MTSQRFGVLILAIFVAFAAAFACGGKGKAAEATPTAAAYKVLMKGYAFEPAALTVPIGATVTWTNTDSAEHDVVSGADGKADGVFASPAMKKGATFSFKFENAGTYAYYCAYHASMKGTITVTASK